MTSRMALTVGPVLYYWPRKTLAEFYAQIADSPADTVVLGEVVCSRRSELKFDDWLGFARNLRAAGKQVLLATPGLVESESDLRWLRRHAEQDEFMVEAGDASALHVLQGRGFGLSSHINVYSRAALEEHASMGAQRWVPPVEIDMDTVALINPPQDPVKTKSGEPVATELWAFGRLPLAFSARCFTARHHHLGKDECDFRCQGDADGLLLSSTEGQPFLVLNGIQTQSAGQHCLIDQAERLRATGISRVRLSPCSKSFAEVLRWHDQVFNHGGDPGEALTTLRALNLAGGLVNGYSRRRPGIEWSAA